MSSLASRRRTKCMGDRPSESSDPSPPAFGRPSEFPRRMNCENSRARLDPPAVACHYSPRSSGSATSSSNCDRRRLGPAACVARSAGLGSRLVSGSASGCSPPASRCTTSQRGLPMTPGSELLRASSCATLPGIHTISTAFYGAPRRYSGVGQPRRDAIQLASQAEMEEV
jgi:hypothetical protein